jgi:hypothetical protein
VLVRYALGHQCIEDGIHHASRLQVAATHFIIGVAMSAEAVKKLWAEFDDLASKSENEDVQFLIRAIKLHAEVTNIRLAALESLADKAARNPAK